MESPFEGMIREAGEEASIPESLARDRLQPCDALSVAYPRSNHGKPAYQHHTAYVFEIELDNEHLLSCDSDEVAEFKQLTLEEVRLEIDLGTFIPMAQLVYTSHFIRHGVITAETDDRMAEALSRMHRRHQLFMPETGDGSKCVMM
jgi:8-oxo-dGTP pyrophosphatase MutT (NUDIX family)